MVPLFIKSLIATICILSILIYDFMCLCRIIGKEKWVEKIYNSLVTKLEYNEDIVFRLIRPLFLTTSFMMFLLTFYIFLKLTVYLQKQLQTDQKIPFSFFKGIYDQSA